MFLEVNLLVYDPLARYLDLSQITGDKQTKTEWINENGKLVTHYGGLWMTAAGPGGIKDQFNQMGLLNAKTGKPFQVLSQAEFQRQLRTSHCLIM
jgi:hypothetical protein